MKKGQKRIGTKCLKGTKKHRYQMFRIERKKKKWEYSAKFSKVTVKKK